MIISLFLTQEVTLAQVETGAFKYDGEYRDYKVYLPSGYTDSKAFPIVINLHPYTFNATWEIQYTRLHVVADTLGFIVVYPNALENWNSGISYDNKWPTPDVDDVGFINAMIDTLSNHYNIDSEKVFACGFSNGGFMSLKLAGELSHRIAAVASVGGVVTNSNIATCDPSRAMPVLLICGTEDPICAGNSAWLSADQSASFWSSKDNCVEENSILLEDVDPSDGCTVEKISYTSCDDNRKIIYYRIIGGGHTWPGGYVEKNNDGNTNMDINANYEILNFFKGIQLTPVSVNSYEYDHPFSTHPNPFSSETIISFQLPTSSEVEIRIYNISGQEIKTFILQDKNAGTHEIVWDGTNNDGENISNGLYLISLSALRINRTIKVMLLR
jgi:polyhydroxybutyrate depolymerase